MDAAASSKTLMTSSVSCITRGADVVGLRGFDTLPLLLTFRRLPSVAILFIHFRVADAFNDYTLSLVCMQCTLYGIGDTFPTRVTLISSRLMSSSGGRTRFPMPRFLMTSSSDSENVNEITSPISLLNARNGRKVGSTESLRQYGLLFENIYLRTCKHSNSKYLAICYSSFDRPIATSF